MFQMSYTHYKYNSSHDAACFKCNIHINLYITSVKCKLEFVPYAILNVKQSDVIIVDYLFAIFLFCNLKESCILI